MISIVQLVPVIGQFNCTQWRKLNSYDSNSESKSSNKYFILYHQNRGLFTRRNQDDRMNMTETGEHDQKSDNDEH